MHVPATPSWLVAAAMLAGVACTATPPRQQITIADAEQIRIAALQHLRDEKLTELPLPDGPEHDPWGNIRLGAWLIETSTGEPLLTYRISESRANIVRRELVLARTASGWTVLRSSDVIHHRAR